VFAPARWEKVEVAATPCQLRQAFTRWGRPQWLRVDNGHPWGGGGDLPTEVALWVLGHGIALHWNDPCCPQQNARVERTQGVSKGWVDPSTCADCDELQGRCDANDRIQREVYPSCGGLSRLAAHPGLGHSGRPYAEGWEEHHWRLQGVFAYLGGLLLRRRVDSGGKVSLYRHNYTVGRRYAGQDLWVWIDEGTHEWVFATEQGAIDRQEARELTRANILALSVARHSRPPR